MIFVEIQFFKTLILDFIFYARSSINAQLGVERITLTTCEMSESFVLTLSESQPIKILQVSGTRM